MPKTNPVSRFCRALPYAVEVHRFRGARLDPSRNIRPSTEWIRNPVTLRLCPVYIAKGIERGNILQPPLPVNARVRFLKYEARRGGTPIIVFEVKGGWLWRYNPPMWLLARWPIGFFRDQLRWLEKPGRFGEELALATMEDMRLQASVDAIAENVIKS